MPFSWVNARARHVKFAVAKAKIQAHGKHPDFAIRHPGEVRDAQQKNYAVLEKRIKEECQKAFDTTDRRAQKLAGKDKD